MIYYYKQDEVQRWEFEEFNHSFSMDADNVLPAGSMRNLSSPEDGPWIVPRFFYREN